MLREDFIILFPAIIILLVKYSIWQKINKTIKKDTETSGEYNNQESQFRLQYLDSLVLLILVVQLGYPLLTINNAGGRIILVGYLLIILGFVLSLFAIKALGNNWISLHEYQIKKGQRLVTSGPYKFIRHPIYLAVILELTGFEIVARSWLFLVFLFLGLLFMIKHIKKEDLLLEAKFKDEFKTYKSKTKALIPFVY